MPTSVRRAVPGDLHAVGALHTAVWKESYAGLVSSDYLADPARVQRREQRWAARLAGDREVWLAYVDGVLAGVVSAGPSRDEPPVSARELMSLYVLARYHGTGLADRLLKVAVGDGPASLWVFEGNGRARAFYLRHGFRPDGRSAFDDDSGLVEIRMVRGEAPRRS